MANKSTQAAANDLPLDPKRAPLSAETFTPIEALRSLVLFHDSDPAFLTANRSVIADLPMGEMSFGEALWQVARDICAANPAKPE